MYRRFSSLLLLIGIMMLLAACSSQAQAQTDFTQRQIKVVTTIGMITDIVGQVGGERVEVDGLMGPGVDPHLYKASEGDVRALSQANVIFYDGLHLEAGMASVLERMQDQQIRTVAVTDTIDRSRLKTPPEFEGAYDPHVWFDVTLWMKAVEQVRDTLSDMDPNNAAMYSENASTYIDDLKALHAYVLEQASRVPQEQRVLITAHDAFNYFGEAYGFEVRGLQGISTASEPSTADVANLAKFIATHKIPAVFVESSVPRRNIEAVQAAVKANGYDVAIGGELFSDAMGNPDSAEGTYLGMVRHNVDTIVGGLINEE